MVNQLVAGMEELLQRTVGSTVTLATALDEGAGSILCDANQLENALLNLAINARGRDARRRRADDQHARGDRRPD